MRPLLLLCALVSFPALLFAPPPLWWTEAPTRIIDPQATPAPLSPVNLGQLKHVAAQAKKHLDTVYGSYGGAGSEIDALVAAFSKDASTNAAPALLGQIKAVAKPFYIRLQAIGYDTRQNLIAHGYPASWPHATPWDPATPAGQNQALATLGQLKIVFSFDLTTSTDGSPLPNWWRNHYFGTLAIDPAANADGDSLTNLQEWQQNSDPTDYYNGELPELRILSGNDQSGQAGDLLAEPLVVEVRSGTTPLGNAPVTFIISDGDGQIAANGQSATLSAPLTVRTDAATGRASVSYTKGSTAALVHIAARVASGTQQIAVTFQVKLTSIVTIDPAGGSFPTGQHVAISCSHSGATIRYSLDGSEPDAWSPIVGSAGTVKVDQTAVLKAKAFLSGQPVSLAASSPFTITGAVAAGVGHHVALKADGSVWAWGFNSGGHLGDGTGTDSDLPVQVTTSAGTSISDVVSIVAGKEHSLALRRDGSVWAWGLNNHGQLGDGTTNTASRAVQVQGIGDVRAIEAGFEHSVALKNDGTVWTWGNNHPFGDTTAGVLGAGSANATESVPLQVMVNATTPLAGIVQIKAGSYFTFAKMSNGTVWGWGTNYYGEFADGTYDNRPFASELPHLAGIASLGAADGFAFGIATSGALQSWGWNGRANLALGYINDGQNPSLSSDVLTPRDAVGLPALSQIDGGLSHTLALSRTGELWGAGDNSARQVGAEVDNPVVKPARRSFISQVVSFCAGYDQSLAVKQDGSVWIWGASYGANGAIREYPVASKIPDFSLLHLQDADGDGLDDWRELQNGTDRSDRALPLTLEKISGDGQSGIAGAVLPAPLVVRAKRGGATLANVTVEVGVKETDARLSASPDGSDSAQTLTLTTDAAGQLAVYVSLPTQVGETALVEMLAGAANTVGAAYFTASTGGVFSNGYEYDAAGRLIRAKHQNNSSTRITPDPNNNILSITRTSP